MSHSNISVFVPHLGCTHNCSFCNQNHITGAHHQPSRDDVISAVTTAKMSSRFNPSSAEIAFFGGSFTAIEKTYMLELLSAAFAFVKDGSVSGIRISTRPDCIDRDVLSLLKEFGVTAIELGAQSMCDDVLEANGRGHRAEDVSNASMLIKDFGFELGLQMMTGLYTSDEKLDIDTAKQIIKLRPDTVRIYPTITLKDTELCNLYNKKLYAPQALDKAVELCVRLEDMFVSNGIRVIRVGLHDIDQSAYVAGPWHPAFHELCESFRFKTQLKKRLKEGSYEVSVNPSYLSKFIGQNRSNVKYFQSKNIFIKFLPSKSVDEGKFVIKEVNQNAADIGSDSRL